MIDEEATAKSEQLKPRFPVVGIGASAGGLSALQKFFEATPTQTGMAFVVIVHLDPKHKSHMAELLQSRTQMPVREVSRPISLRPNHIYIIPPDKDLTLTDGRFRLSPRAVPNRTRAPIDGFFQTLAETHSTDGVAIVLSGSGSDGAQGVKWVKERGGLTMAQAPEEAEHRSMPESAIATGQVDVVLPVAKLAAEAARIIQGAPSTAGRVRAAAKRDDGSVSEILDLVGTRLAHDFSEYRRPTIDRRVRRRMQLARLPDLRAYLGLLSRDADEIVALYNDLLIAVTGFFRDADAFAALESEVIPGLFHGKSSSETIRVWVTGCATGEEAYSVAMLLCEEAEKQPDPPLIQIFATDVHERSFTFAREGLYSESIASDVSPARLERFFVHESHGYRLKKVVREKVVFATHNLLTDPPFLRLDLITCRNVLIYLRQEAQRRILEAFHFGLREGGALFLGTSESIEAAARKFAVVNKKHRIFRSIGTSRPPIQPGSRKIAASRTALVPAPRDSDGQASASTHARRSATKQSSARSRASLKETRGRRSATSRSVKGGVKSELTDTKELLRRTIAEHERVVEELKASNEELQSINEEQKATEEELEASKEELQSINEELQTVNQEYRSKNEELIELNSDLVNLIDSTDIGTIFIDKVFRIRRFTPMALNIFNLLPTDAGRPLSDLTHRFDYPTLIDDAREVLRTLGRLEREVAAEGDRWFTVRLSPYRSLDDRIEGVVITFTDTSRRKKAELKSELAMEELQAISLAKSNLLGVMSHELRTPLNAIVGYADILDAGAVGDLTPEQHHHLERIASSARHLAHMIDDSLQSVRIEAGITSLEKELVDLSSLVREVGNAIQPLMQAKMLNFRCEIEDGVRITTDGTKLRQILYNVLGNAVRYTDAGTVTLSAHRERDSVVIAVEDTGIGISPDNLEQIFERFWQADQSTTRIRGGAGLGLNVSRSLARIMGGDIEATSEIGQGSRFVIRLPGGDGS